MSRDSRLRFAFGVFGFSMTVLSRAVSENWLEIFRWLLDDPAVDLRTAPQWAVWCYEFSNYPVYAAGAAIVVANAVFGEDYKIDAYIVGAVLPYLIYIAWMVGYPVIAPGA